jgi:hypothetical protein
MHCSCRILRWAYTLLQARTMSGGTSLSLCLMEKSERKWDLKTQWCCYTSYQELIIVLSFHFDKVSDLS